MKQFDGYGEEWLDFVVMNRDESNPASAHDYDIVEGPVADDKEQNRIIDYLNGTISKADFLEELEWHEQTYQICFCTVQSLQMIDLPDRIGMKRVMQFTHIGEPVVERLMLDHDMGEEKATDAFYTSDTFARLADESTGLCQKPWTEIYEMLKSELKI
jgi:hypothetical protein